MRLIENNIPCLLIGSAAAHFWWPKFRKPKDFDVYCSDYKLAHQLRPKFDVQMATEENAIIKFMDYAKHCYVGKFKGFKLPIASPGLLLAIKRIHVNYPRKWQRNILDYIILSKIVEDDNQYSKLISSRMKYLDKITKIKRTLKTPKKFWNCNIKNQAQLLKNHSLKRWCIYSVSLKLRQFIQDNYEALNEENRKLRS